MITKQHILRSVLLLLLHLLLFLLLLLHFLLLLLLLLSLRLASRHESVQRRSSFIHAYLGRFHCVRYFVNVPERAARFVGVNGSFRVLSNKRLHGYERFPVASSWGSRIFGVYTSLGRGRHKYDIRLRLLRLLFQRRKGRLSSGKPMDTFWDYLILTISDGRLLPAAEMCARPSLKTCLAKTRSTPRVLPDIFYFYEIKNVLLDCRSAFNHFFLRDIHNSLDSPVGYACRT